MVPVYSVLYTVYFLWKISVAFIYGAGLCRSNDDGQAVFVDLVSVLFCSICKTGSRRNFARRKRDAKIHDGDVYRFDFACRPGICFFRCDGFCNGHLVRMAGWMDHCHGLFRCLLPQGVQEIVSRCVNLFLIVNMQEL